jgi:flagellar hook-associated protein 1 FlgK
MGLSQIQTDVNGEISQSVGEINQLTGQISALNEKIASVEVSGQNANDYRDMRGQLLQQLSGKIDVQYYEDNSGQLVITGAGSVNLVEGKISHDLSVSENSSNNGYYDVVYDTGSGTTLNITNRISGGALAGLIGLRDTTIPGIKSDLDQLAYGIVTDINTQHQAGYGLDASTGNNLFGVLSSSQDAAMNMSVTLTDIKKLAASSSIDGLPGDNSNALSLVQLQDQSTMSSGQFSFNSFYNDLAQRVGATSQSASRNLDAQNFTVQQMDTMRESVSGVSLDEEMSNLLKYQRAFEASAKLITIADDLLKTVIGMV